jgi:ABC-type tungstate transport system substrate-binding protein
MRTQTQVHTQVMRTKLYVLSLILYHHSLSVQTDLIGTIVYSLVVRDGDEGTNSEISFALTSPVSNNYCINLM